MKIEYLELAQKACVEERQENWFEACKLWMAAIEHSCGIDRLWATKRFEYCCSRYGIRPSSF